MEWNNGLMTRRFNETQKSNAAFYRSVGMTEYQIEQMHLFDIEKFNSDRRFAERTQQFPESPFVDSDDGQSPLYERFLEELTVTADDFTSVSRYWWIEEIDNPQLAKEIKSLTKNDIELITLFVYDRYTHAEIAKCFGVGRRAITKRIEKLRKIFEEVLKSGS